MRLLRRVTLLVAALPCWHRCGRCADIAGVTEANDRPLYPLYAMVTGSVEFTDKDIDLIASSFDYCHCTTSRQQAAALREVYQPFRSVQYSNPSATRDGSELSGDLMGVFERQHRNDKGGGWYVAGRLCSTIDPEATEIFAEPDRKKIGTIPRLPAAVMLVPSSPKAGNYSGLDPSSGRFQWVTYARIDDELLKIVSVENASDFSARVVVERGFDGTTPAAHSAGAPVLAPLYNQLPAVDSDGTDGNSATLSYGLMADTDFASDFLVNATNLALTAGYDGSWYDCFGSSIFTVETATGVRLGVQDYWDPLHGHYWNVSTYLAAQRKRLDRAYSAIVKEWPHARQPTILANGFWAGFGAFPVSDGFGMLKSDRPGGVGFQLDGYCLENFYMSEHGPCGIDSIRSYHTEKEWLKNVQAVATAAQINAAVFPTIAGAGCGSQAMEANPNRTRDEGAAYASFLLAVERTAAAGGRPSLGIPALYYESPANRTSLRYAALHPRFRWEIGTPVETKVAVPLYKLPGFNTYARRFTTGLVLMNPSWNATDRLDLVRLYPRHRYVDKGNDVPTGMPVPSPVDVNQVVLPPQSALILVATAAITRGENETSP